MGRLLHVPENFDHHIIHSTSLKMFPFLTMPDNQVLYTSSQLEKYRYLVYAMKDCLSRLIICWTKQTRLDLMVQAAMVPMLLSPCFITTLQTMA